MSERSFRRSRAKRLDRQQRRLSNAKRRMLVVGATLGATAAFAANAEAQTYTVNSTADTGTGTCAPSPGVCTLRDAITQADSSGVAGTPDTITFDSSVTGTITLTQGEIAITDPGGLTIQGPGAGTLSVSGGGTSRIFDLNSSSGNPDVTISGLTMTHGYTSSPGGALYDRNEPLTLSGDTISGSQSTLTGGGIDSKYQVNITDSTISGNTSGGGGASGFGGGGVAIQGTAALSIADSKVDGNQDYSSNAGGGVLNIGGSLSVTGSQVTNNSTLGSGGGIAAETKYGTTIDGSTVSGNTAADGGGLSLYGTLFGDAATNNPIVVSNSTISQNQAPKGAGIDVKAAQGTSPVTVKASTISGNQGGSGSSGGGLLISGQLENPFDLVDSTITGNSATDGGGVSLSYAGSTTPLVGTNATTGSSGSIAFDNSTIDGNTADGKGGGIYLAAYNPQVDPSGTADVNSTIVANDTANGAPNDLYQGDTNPGSGGINSTFSLIQNPGNAVMLSSQALITGVDPQLNALADNGGPTETMLPKNSSPVIDQGKAQSGLTTDQRGDPRTVDNGKTKPAGGDGTDIGAVELAKIPPPPPPPPSKPPAKPPAATPSISDTIGPASGITDTSATLHGTIDTNGQAVTWHFEYGTTTAGAVDARARRSGDPVTPTQSISAGHGQVSVSFKVTGLKPGTHYHYRLVAVSGKPQTAISGYAAFTTPKPTIKVKPGAVRAAHAVRVFGSAGACTRGSRMIITSGVFSAAHKFKGRHALYAKVGKGARYSVVTRIPAGRQPGRYAITGHCAGSAVDVTTFLRVLPPPPVVKFTG